MPYPRIIFYSVFVSLGLTLEAGESALRFCESLPLFNNAALYKRQTLSSFSAPESNIVFYFTH